jgi:uncharacterized protein (DUF885 family)
MKRAWRTAGWAGLLLGFALGYGVYRTVWGKPFTIDMLANRQAFEFLIRNPELATAVGIAEGSFVDYHSDKLEPSTLEQRDDTYAQFSKVERYMAMPGQACAYKVGQLKILELRAKASAALGAKFDLKDFHAVILENGGVRLTVLEQLVDEWIARTRGSAS